MGFTWEGVHTVAGLWERVLEQVDHETPIRFADPLAPAAARSAGLQLSYREMNAKAHCLAAFLMLKGLRPGACIAILSEPMPIVTCYDLATHLGGMTSLHLDPRWNESLQAELLEQTQAQALLLPSYAAYRRHQALYDRLAPRCPVLCFTQPTDEVQEHDSIMLLEYALVQGNIYWREHYSEMKALRQALTPEHVATLAFDLQPAAAGQSPQLRGVVLTQGNLVAAVRSLAECLPVPPGRRMLSVESTADITERTATTYLAWQQQAAVYDAPQTEQLLRYLRRVRPQHLMAFPATLMALMEQALADYRARHWLRKSWLAPALRTAQRYLQQRQARARVPLRLRMAYGFYQRWVFRSMYRRHFRSLDTLLVQGWGLSAETERFFHALGCPPRVGLSTPESAGFLSLTPAQVLRVGSLGQPLSGVRLRAEPGSLRLGGPQRMLHSWQERRPQAYAYLPITLCADAEGHLWWEASDAGLPAEVDDTLRPAEATAAAQPL